MPTSAKPGSKCVLKVGDGGGTEVFTVIAEVKGVRGPSLSGGVVDVTSFDSAGIREFVATLRDAGTLSFTANYIPSASANTHQSLITDMKNGTTRNFKLEFQFSPTVTMSFSGVVTGGEIGAELEQAVSLSITIKVTGWPVWT